jgi:hypothetical protein
MKDLMKSGALGLGTAALAKNPEMLRGFGLVGNIAANKMDDREDKKRNEAMKAAAATEEKKPTTAMKKGGYVKAADGICKKGKTKGRMV